MKILFGNHHLELRAGSELFTAELARCFQARGNDVAIFTFFKGEFAGRIEAEGIRVFDPSDAAELSRFLPDIVQTCHIPCAHFLRSVVPDAVRVHAMLGVLPSLEAPPLGEAAFSLGLAVSEEVLDRVNRTPFGRDVEVALFRNWFDDASVVVAPASVRRRSQRVAVISHHIAPDLVEALAALEGAGEVEVDYFGTQRKSAIIDGALLVQYDLAISIGRTVVLAAACGVPCIMADIHGSDGLLTTDNIDRVKAVNFSGRSVKQVITSRHLCEEIEKINWNDQVQLREKVASEYSLSARVDWLQSRYETLLERRRGDPIELGIFTSPSEGLVYAEITAEVRMLRGQLAQAQVEINKLNADLRSSRTLKNVVKSVASKTSKIGGVISRSVGFHSRVK